VRKIGERKSAPDGQRRKHANRNRHFRRNLLHRLERPAYRNGKHQKMIARVMAAFGGEASTAQVIRWTHCDLFHRGGRFLPRHYHVVRHALRSMGYVPIRRAGGMGRPWVWGSG
jgi:hypothetical protein